MTGPAEEPEQVRLVRTADLADLRFDFPGLSFRRPAAGRILVRTTPEREGLIVVTFAAQHVVEQAFFESAGAGPPDPVPVQPHPAPPVVSRISGRTVLVFVVGPEDEVPYTAEGLLAAMRRLPLRTVGDEGPAGPLRDPAGDPRTTIELPYRLLLSPPPDPRWTHRTAPADDADRVELWHTRVRDTRARAVWTRDFPGDTPVDPPPDPLTTSLTPADRAALVHLTSDRGPFTEPGHRPYVPPPVEVGHLRQALAIWDDAPAGVLPLRQAIESAGAGLRLPESVAVRLEWTPGIQPWSLREGEQPVFVPHDGSGDPAREGRLSMVVDLRAALRPDIRPAADVTCTLEEFDLVLLPGVLEAMRLDFRRIRFTARAGEKPEVEVAFRNVEFVGALSFAETLRRIIPLDGFSDPPTLDVSPRGVLARYGTPLPNLAIGVFSLENISLNAYLDLPFAGTRPLEIGFAFCRRDAPFRLTVSLFGGGGWFGIVLPPDGVRALRYFRARGEVDALGLVSASIELYLELGYEGGDAVGRARITITIEIGFFEESVEIGCEKRFGGARSLTAAAEPAGDAVADGGEGAGSAATFARMMAPYRDPVTGARRDPVAE
ncbi:hypothetical protein [Nonomuraea sp. NPDC049684]|uniref:hypothetical protein n=1 Tax=Nonomuraea sp. NPDC049684 TaxID=3364356 RepID=UPI0037AB4342